VNVYELFGWDVDADDDGSAFKDFCLLDGMLSWTDKGRFVLGGLMSPNWLYSLPA